MLHCRSGSSHNSLSSDDRPQGLRCEIGSVRPNDRSAHPIQFDPRKEFRIPERYEYARVEQRFEARESTRTVIEGQRQSMRPDQLGIQNAKYHSDSNAGGWVLLGWSTNVRFGWMYRNRIPHSAQIACSFCTSLNLTFGCSRLLSSACRRLSSSPRLKANFPRIEPQRGHRNDFAAARILDFCILRSMKIIGKMTGNDSRNTITKTMIPYGCDRSVVFTRTPKAYTGGFRCKNASSSPPSASIASPVCRWR